MRSAPLPGRFVRNGDVVTLQSRGGDVWPLSSVSIMAGLFAGKEEGLQKLPRPYEYNEDGTILIRGDEVAIFFLHGSPKLPLVMPGVRPVDSNDFLAYNHRVGASSTANRLALRLHSVDAEGVQQGLIEVVAGVDGDEGPSGDIALTMDGVLTITISRDAGDHVLKIDPDGGIEIDAGAGSDIILNGGTAKVCRVGDSTVGHTHDTTALTAGGDPIVGLLGTSTDTMDQGADRVKA